jgi:hypothetical protein
VGAIVYDFAYKLNQERYDSAIGGFV